MKRHRFHPEARSEARAAVAWYRERSPAAALELARAIADGVRNICEYPEAWSTWRHPEVRRFVLRSLPYSIFYVLEGDLVVIIAIAHHKRRAGYWLARLRS